MERFWRCLLSRSVHLIELLLVSALLSPGQHTHITPRCGAVHGHALLKDELKAVGLILFVNHCALGAYFIKGKAALDHRLI